MNAAKQIEVKNNKVKLLAMAMLSFVFVAGATYTLIFSPSKGLSAFVLLIFALAAIAFLRVALDKKPQLVIGTEGIYAPRFARDFIPWEMVQDAIVWNSGRLMYVAIITNDDLAGEVAAKSEGGKYVLKDDGKRWYSIPANNLAYRPSDLAKFIKKLKQANETERAKLIFENADQ